MIISRSPLRISLGGGGTDLPSYYLENEGFLIAAAIDKYVYTTVTKPFTKGIFLKYSKLEKTDHVNKIQHNIIRESLKELKILENQIEITTLADIPSGTGLGSSGSFTNALIKSLFTYQRKHIDPLTLAEISCKIEIENLNHPSGKQDQYISSFGGLTSFQFFKNNDVKVEPLNVDEKTINNLEDKLLLFFTGFTRKSESLLLDQKNKSLSNNQEMLENLNFVKKLGIKSKTALEKGDLNLFGNIMNEHWEFKKLRTQGMTNNDIDNWYSLAIKNGAVGGKVVGAGGGGFLMFLASDPDKLRNAMSKEGLQEVRFRFDFEGTKILMASK